MIKAAGTKLGVHVVDDVDLDADPIKLKALIEIFENENIDGNAMTVLAGDTFLIAKEVSDPSGAAHAFER